MLYPNHLLHVELKGARVSIQLPESVRAAADPHYLLVGEGAHSPERLYRLASYSVDEVRRVATLEFTALADPGHLRERSMLRHPDYYVVRHGVHYAFTRR